MNTCKHNIRSKETSQWKEDLHRTCDQKMVEGLLVFQLNGHYGRWVFCKNGRISSGGTAGSWLPMQETAQLPRYNQVMDIRERVVSHCCTECLDCGFLFILIWAECLMSQIIFTRLQESYLSLKLFCAFSNPHKCLVLKLLEARSSLSSGYNARL